MNWYKKAQGSISLWLDDERDPKSPIIQKDFRSTGNEVWVKDVPEAINYLESNNVESISFDNDLAQPLEGYDLARWIEEKAYFNEIPRLKWVVHSRNPTAATRIEQAMRNADKYWGKHELV